jgi:sugar lactone lactonase YvrE
MATNKFQWLLATLASVCLGLAGCGGGGSDSGEGPPPAPTTVTLYAGALQSTGSSDGVGAAAQFNGPADVAQDGAGNVFVTDTFNHTIRRIATDGTVTTVAGTAGQSGSADGTGAAARFSAPMGIAVGLDGTIYVSDTGNGTLRRISTGGAVTTISGVAGQKTSIDGGAAVARFNTPGSMAVDAAGALYVIDDNTVRKRTPDGTVSTFAGQAGYRGPTAFGNAAQARFSSLDAVGVDGAGNVYVSESGFSNVTNGTIRKFDAQGQALPFGPGTTGVATGPYAADISVDVAGNLYLVTNGTVQPSPNFGTVYRTLEVLSPDGLTRTTLAGGNNDVRSVDGPSASARFLDPTAVAAGPNGRIVVAEASTGAIRLVQTQAGVVSSLAGGAGAGDVDGAAATARFGDPLGIAAAADGTLYVADSRNHSVRKISTAGAVSTLSRSFRFPQNVAIAPGSPTVYELDTDSTFGRNIAAVAPDGSTSSIGSFPPNSRRAFAADAAGNLYGADHGDVIVRAPDGTRRVLASAVQALNVTIDPGGTVYFSSGRATINVIDASGAVSVRAGSADQPGDADGAGQQARFRAPDALALDAAGNLYVADGTRIRKVSPTGSVTTLADVTQVQGAQAGFKADSITVINGLVWSGGSLYATVLNAVVRISP